MSKTSEFILEVCEWYDRGLHPDEIARSMKVSMELVYSVLENYSDSFKEYVAWCDSQDTHTK